MEAFPNWWASQSPRREGLPTSGQTPSQNMRTPQGVVERIVNGLQDGAIVTDAKGRILHVNGAAHTMFGYAPEEIRGRPVAMLDVAHLPLGSDEELSFAIAAQGVWQGYTAGLHRDGTTFPVNMTVIVLNEDCRPEDGYLVIYRNVSEGIQALEDLRATLFIAQSARQAQRNILHAITHEFRTPLAAIIGFSDLLNNTSEMPAVARDFIEAIRSSTERLKVLVESVIEYANIQAERTVVHSETYDIRRRLPLFLEPFAQHVRAKGIEWDYRVDRPVPKTIVTDGEKLERILELLFDNAVKFTHSGSIRLAVMETPGRDDTLNFVIEDTGVGYEPAITEQLFEPFRQGDEGLTRRHSGIGLGLALARQLAQLLGGTLKGESQPGRGSVFTLTLPITVPSSETGEEGKSAG